MLQTVAGAAGVGASVQAQIINLLGDLQQTRADLSVIAHDLAVVRHVADRDALYAEPLHPYTQLLLAAVPIPDPALEAQRVRSVPAGEVPGEKVTPSDCVFQMRCPRATAECGETVETKEF